MTDIIIEVRSSNVNEAKFRFLGEHGMGLECVFGPVSKTDALALAALSKDYNPVLLVPDVALAKGRPGTHLHPLWVSGMVERCVRKLIPNSAIVELTLSFLSMIPREETLCFEAQTTKDGSLVTIAIFNSRGEKMAEAQAKCSGF